MKKYISRPDAVKKYRIGYKTIERWHATGKLKPYDPKSVAYGERKHVGGVAPKYVYDEDELAILAAKAPIDASVVKRNRIEAQAVVMLDDGADVVKLVKELNIGMSHARQIRNAYLLEKDAIIIPGEEVRAIRELGFPITGKNAAATIKRIIDWARDIKARHRRSDKPPEGED